jgi:hypothetical protein
VTEPEEPVEGTPTSHADPTEAVTGHVGTGDVEFEDVPPTHETGMAGEADPAAERTPDSEERGEPDLLP